MREPRTYICRCGHLGIDHAPARVTSVAGLVYKTCRHDGCLCTWFVPQQVIPGTEHLWVRPPEPTRRPEPEVQQVVVQPRIVAAPKRSRWRHEEVVWGLTFCSADRCMNDAAVLYDGEPLCVDCAENLLERELALELNPTLRDSLPPLLEGAESDFPAWTPGRLGKGPEGGRPAPETPL